MTAKQPTRLVTLHALTFLHPGTGQTTGVVDLPVQREVHTGYPMIASSGLKGAMREKAEQAWGRGSDKVAIVFGPDTGQGETAGALAVTDARILLLPVRSLQQIFFWVTCPMVIDRLARDLAFAGIANAGVPKNIGVTQDGCIPPEDSGLSGALVLEELRLEVEADPSKQKLCSNLVTALKSFAPSLTEAGFAQRLLIITDYDFAYFCRYALQVSARIALNEKKTTTGGGGNLWYEETLPPETVMYALLLANKPRYTPPTQSSGGREAEGTAGKADSNGETAAQPAPLIQDANAVIAAVNGLLDNQYLQVGGNETVGQGWCCVALTDGVATRKGSETCRTGEREGGEP